MSSYAYEESVKVRTSSTGVLYTSKIIAACEKAIVAVDEARVEEKKKWEEEKDNPTMIEEEVDTLFGTFGIPFGKQTKIKKTRKHMHMTIEINLNQLKSGYTYGDQREICERVLNLARKVDQETMTISANDFNKFGSWYDIEENESDVS